MGISYRFIATPIEPSEVIGWFRSLSDAVTEVHTEYGYALYFKELGPLVRLSDGKIDAEASPIVTIVLPQVRRGVLWTIGEVHFRSTPLRKQFPALHKINGAFSKWLSAFECVYSNQSSENLYSYYFEGSAQNLDAPIFALQSGLEALKKERYFVSHMDNPSRLDSICKRLRLRGIDCADA